MVFQEDNIAYILGILASIFALSSNIPQIYHNIKYKNVDGINILFILFRLLYTAFLISYGIYLKLLILIILNIASFISTSIMLYYWKYGIKNDEEES